MLVWNVKWVNHSLVRRFMNVFKCWECLAGPHKRSTKCKKGEYFASRKRSWEDEVIDVAGTIARTATIFAQARKARWGE